MAILVGGVGVPHTPQMGIPPGGWLDHGTLHDCIAIPKTGVAPSRRHKDDIARELDPELIEARHGAAQVGLATIAETIKGMEPDVLVVVGDDQHEMFLDDGIPAIAIFWGDVLYDRPPGADAYPPSMKAAYRWYHGEDGTLDPYPTSSSLGRHLVEELMGARFDVAQFSQQPEQRTLGHAFTFIKRRVLGGEAIPMVPVLLNAYYPPNQPGPARCVELGRALGDAIRRWPGEQRVVLVASGGLSHPIIDEELDRGVLAALCDHDLDALARLPADRLVEGTSEIRNWIAVGAALQQFDPVVLDYIPAYRSELGSGCGMAFMRWTGNGA